MSSNYYLKKEFDILVVENESTVSNLINNKYNEFGIKSNVASKTVLNTMVYLNNSKPDIAIIDIYDKMSNSCIDIANYIWKSFNIPIIYLFEKYDKFLFKKSLEAEPYGYLIKPFKKIDLHIAINTALHKHHYFYKNRNLINKMYPKFINISKHIKFDIVNCELYLNKKNIKLTNTEKKLFQIISLQSGKYASFDTIYNFIWREDAYDLAKLRSLVYRIKNKLNFNPFENLYNEGYKIKIIN